MKIHLSLLCLCFFLGATTGKSLTYPGRAADAPWRKQAAERIEKLRKADLTVKVIDASNKPVANADVQVKLGRHAFGFGTCVTAHDLLATTPDAQEYRDFIEKYCNRAVFENDMKWPAMERGPSPQLDQALQWLLDRNIEVRGHNLIWPSWKWSPKSLRQLKDNPAGLRRVTGERVTSAVAHFKGKLIQWDVVNEPYSEHDLLDVLGRDVMVEWFKLARQADPACKLYLNDFGILESGPTNKHRQAFYDTIVHLREQGAPIDGVGLQSHFESYLPPPTQLLEVLDQFSKLELPIESTEVSLNVADEQLKADYLRDYTTVMFSHPRVQGVMLWGFWEGRHWRPKAALFAKDWTPKPAARAWMDLITREWATDVTTKTDANGIAKIRGFLGDYEITVDAKRVEGKLEARGTEIVVKLP